MAVAHEQDTNIPKSRTLDHRNVPRREASLLANRSSATGWPRPWRMQAAGELTKLVCPALPCSSRFLLHIARSAQPRRHPRGDVQVTQPHGPGRYIVLWRVIRVIAQAFALVIDVLLLSLPRVPLLAGRAFSSETVTQQRRGRGRPHAPSSIDRYTSLL